MVFRVRLSLYSLRAEGVYKSRDKQLGVVEKPLPNGQEVPEKPVAVEQQHSELLYRVVVLVLLLAVVLFLVVPLIVVLPLPEPGLPRRFYGVGPPLRKLLFQP